MLKKNQNPLYSHLSKSILAKVNKFHVARQCIDQSRQPYPTIYTYIHIARTLPMARHVDKQKYNHKHTSIRHTLLANAMCVFTNTTISHSIVCHSSIFHVRYTRCGVCVSASLKPHSTFNSKQNSLHIQYIRWAHNTRTS